MTVRHQFAAVLIAAVLLLGAGCGGSERAVFTVETDDPYFREGQRLVRQGRDAEALSAFLKVIDKRGTQEAAESHLEAGLIYLNHIKNPIEAIHHFRKYLELQPKAKQSPGVRDLINTATREFARTIPGHPLESQPVGVDQSEQLRLLQRENDELRAALGAQRAATSPQTFRSSRATVDIGEARATNPSNGGGVPLIMPAPQPRRAAVIEPTIVPTQTAAPLIAPANSTSGKKHTVGVGDTLYNISKRYGVKLEDLLAANRDILPTANSPLRRGAELKIP
jgi:tetratricopeptide (TPR) repeat protein